MDQNAPEFNPDHFLNLDGTLTDGEYCVGICTVSLPWSTSC
jgi:hypothetical protein